MKLIHQIPIIFLIIVCPIVAFGQTEFDDDIQFRSKELDRLRNEIKDFEKRINQTSAREKSTLDKLNELDEEISLVRNLIYRLRKEERIKQTAIKQTQSEIRLNELEYQNLIDRYARRVVDIYKKGRLSDFEILFDSESWRQAIYRTKYLKIISDYDRTLAREIQDKIEKITYKQATLEKDLKDLERIDKEKSTRKEWLERRRRMRNKELSRLKRNRKELSNALNERKTAAQELEKIILDLERKKAARLAELERRRREEEKLLAGGNFAALRGKLPWPVNGKVISRFGTHKNPRLKTVTENTGIDIRGKAGSEVRAVFDGIVTTVTYIRGYGNTIIIDHGNSFYTVYTHVTDMEVSENEYVRARDIIAHVGDSGSLDGAKLHFEIWGKRQKLNPERWLRKS